MTVDRNGVRGDELGFDPKNIAVYGLGYNESGGGYGQVQWSPFALSNDWEYANQNPWGTEWNYGSPRLIETIAWWQSLIEKGYLPSLAIATSGVGTIESIGAGAYATLIEGSWNARAFVDLQGVDVQVAPTPIGPAGQRASVLNGLSDAIWEGTAHPDEAFAWVEYLASPQCQDVVAEQGRVFPAVTSASEKAVETFESIGVDAQAFAVHLEDETGVTSPVSDRWPELQTIMQPTMDSIFAFRDDPESLVSANVRVDALFAD
ncbi:MAG: extracellular solute-binding protein [Cellulomonadaceae bacterium]